MRTPRATVRSKHFYLCPAGARVPAGLPDLTLADLCGRHPMQTPDYVPGGNATYVNNPARRPRRWPWVLVAVFAVVGLLCTLGRMGSSGSDKTDTRSSAAAAAAGVEPISPPAATGGPRHKAAALSDGDHADVAPGTYVTTAPTDGLGLGCTWQRVSALDHDAKSFIAGDIVAAGSPGILVVKASDAGLFLSGGCTWRRK